MCLSGKLLDSIEKGRLLRRICAVYIKQLLAHLNYASGQVVKGHPVFEGSQLTIMALSRRKEILVVGGTGAQGVPVVKGKLCRLLIIVNNVLTS